MIWTLHYLKEQHFIHFRNHSTALLLTYSCDLSIESLPSLRVHILLWGMSQPWPGPAAPLISSRTWPCVSNLSLPRNSQPSAGQSAEATKVLGMPQPHTCTVHKHAAKVSLSPQALGLPILGASITPLPHTPEEEHPKACITA